MATLDVSAPGGGSSEGDPTLNAGITHSNLNPDPYSRANFAPGATEPHTETGRRWTIQRLVASLTVVTTIGVGGVAWANRPGGVAALQGPPGIELTTDPAQTPENTWQARIEASHEAVEHFIQLDPTTVANLSAQQMGGYIAHMAPALGLDVMRRTTPYEVNAATPRDLFENFAFGKNTVANDEIARALQDSGNQNTNLLHVYEHGLPPERYETLVRQYTSPLSKMRMRQGETFDFLGGTYVQEGPEPTVQLPNGSVLTSVVVTHNRSFPDNPTYQEHVYLWAIPAPTPDPDNDIRYAIVRLGAEHYATLTAQNK